MPSLPIFPHNKHPLKWVGLRENNCPRSIQLISLPKGGTELTVSLFLVQNLKHYIELAHIKRFQ